MITFRWAGEEVTLDKRERATRVFDTRNSYFIHPALPGLELGEDKKNLPPPTLSVVKPAVRRRAAL